jgi:demethylmenaquinone methyltransferase / 2-methoxy-6-polyprenyl-1,4-benzoquinol methylase
VGRGPALTPAGKPAGATGAGRPACERRGDPRGASPDLPVDRDPQRIAAMFGGIAPRYDLMNRLMTFGLDGRWRRAAALAAGLVPGERALDACCGTGDLALTLAETCPGCEIVGLDFTAAMLERARQKAAVRALRSAGAPSASPLTFVHGDLLDLPFVAGEFAAVTAGWGVRNVPDVPRAFAEMRRVTRPGGRVVCLESTQPPQGLGLSVQRIWMGGVVPALGRLVAGDPSAYSYLPASVEAFPRADELAAIMAGAGLVRVRYRYFGLGAVALHIGEVPS